MSEKGIRVLCIDGKFDPKVFEYCTNVPVEGEHYTLRYSRKEPNGRLGYLLVEIINPVYQSPHWGMEMIEPSFNSKRFITLTDISEHGLEENHSSVSREAQY